MRRNTSVRPRHLPNTSEYAVRLEITVTRIVTGTVMAIDVVGLSYREAARALRVREATITTRLHRGRQRIARALSDQPAAERARRDI